MPFGEQSLTLEHLVYLSTEQVLADYAHLLATLKPALNASASKVVSFGGSYGGTLNHLPRKVPSRGRGRSRRVGASRLLLALLLGGARRQRVHLV